MAGSGRFGDSTAQHLGYDLCATDACQVYRGVGVEQGPWGQRWVQAVNSTRGEALVYQGAPAQTFYFSTSNGHTLGNADVFGGTPLPYLRSVPERDDGASALSHWSVTMPLTDVTTETTITTTEMGIRTGCFTTFPRTSTR